MELPLGLYSALLSSRDLGGMWTGLLVVAPVEVCPGSVGRIVGRPCYKNGVWREPVFRVAEPTEGALYSRRRRLPPTCAAQSVIVSGLLMFDDAAQECIGVCSLQEDACSSVNSPVLRERDS